MERASISSPHMAAQMTGEPICCHRHGYCRSSLASGKSKWEHFVSKLPPRPTPSLYVIYFLPFKRPFQLPRDSTLLFGWKYGDTSLRVATHCLLGFAHICSSAWRACDFSFCKQEHWNHCGLGSVFLVLAVTWHFLFFFVKISIHLFAKLVSLVQCSLRGQSLPQWTRTQCVGKLKSSIVVSFF